jgi:hypothetical protein
MRSSQPDHVLHLTHQASSLRPESVGSVQHLRASHDDVMHLSAECNAIKKSNSPRSGGHKFLNGVNTMKRYLWVKL